MIQNHVIMKKNYNSSFKKPWRFLFSFLILFLCFGFLSFADIPPYPMEIDGNPQEWCCSDITGSPTFTHVNDPFSTGVLDNQFTMGSKDYNETTANYWSMGQTKLKNDLANGAAVLLEGQYLCFAGDRARVSGAAQIGFWFFLNGTTPVEGDKKNNFQPEHAIGDILIVADFSQGGRYAQPYVYVWTGGAKGTGNLTLIPGASTIVAQNNETTFPVPTGWMYEDPSGIYPINAFFEGYIDLVHLAEQIEMILPDLPELDFCISSFLLECRSSKELNAALDDFIAGSFTVVPELTVEGAEICADEEIPELCAYSEDEGELIYQWYLDLEEDPIHTGQCYTPTVTATTTFWVTVTNELNCTSNAMPATLTIIPLPTYDDVEDVTHPACTFANQAAVNAAFADWVTDQYDNLNVQGGVDPQVTDNSLTVTIPGFCGGEVTVTWELDDECLNTSFTATFKILAPPAVNVTGPESETWSACDFANQAELTAAWQTWLDQFEVLEDGCGVTMPVLPSTGPVLCGTFTSTVEYSVADLCTSDSHTATFTLTAPPAVDVTGPDDEEWSACNFVNQAALNTAWQTWLNQFEVLEDGCGVIMPTLPSSEPVLCEPFTSTVVYAVADLCTSDSHTATFSLTAPPAVEVTGPDDEEWSACDFVDQAALTAAWENWLDQFEVLEDGCGVTMPTLPTVGPVLCEPFTSTVVYAVADLCTSDSHTATFALTVPDPIVAYCSAGSVDECMDETYIDGMFAAWKEGFYFTGGCLDAVDNSAALAALDWRAGWVKETGIVVTFTYQASDICSSDEVTCTFTVPPCIPDCETAYAMGSGATCFIPDFSQWGWTNLIGPGSYNWPLYASAAYCDISKAFLVGNVDVVYAGGYVNVTFNMAPGYSLDDQHVYVGYSMYPTGSDGSFTVAPGQYKNIGPFTGNVYVIVHGVVCGEFNTMPQAAIAPVQISLEPSDLKVYPNPFNTRVTFEFVSGKDANARLDIFNMPGQKVTTLLDRPVEKGVLNRIEYLPDVAPGVLFYRFTLDNEIFNGKLIYNK